MKIFVDDERNPVEDGWTIVRNFMAFADQLDRIQENGWMIEALSFDHDLGEDGGTGMQCLRLFIEAAQDDPFTVVNLSEIVFHSANPIGVENMRGLCQSAQEHGIIPNDVKLIDWSSINTTGWAQMPSEADEPSLHEITRQVANLLTGANKLSGEVRRLAELRKKKMISDVPATQVLIERIDALERMNDALRILQVPISDDEEMVAFIQRFETSRYEDEEDGVLPFEGSERIIRHVIKAINYRAQYETNNAAFEDGLTKARREHNEGEKK